MEVFIYICFFLLLIFNMSLKNGKMVIGAIVLFILGFSIPNQYMVTLFLDIMLFFSIFTATGSGMKSKTTSGVNDSSSSTSFYWLSDSGDSYSGGSDSGCDGGGGGDS